MRSTRWSCCPTTTCAALVAEELVRAHRGRALTPDAPILRGTAQNPDVYFQARETVNPFYDRTPGAVQDAMDHSGRSAPGGPTTSSITPATRRRNVSWW